MRAFLEEWAFLMSYLPDLNLPSVLDSSTADLVADFYKPALAVSVQYDRGVGYFSSGWLRLVAQGMNQFAANGGRARFLTFKPALPQNKLARLSSCQTRE